VFAPDADRENTPCQCPAFDYTRLIILLLFSEGKTSAENLGQEFYDFSKETEKAHKGTACGLFSILIRSVNRRKGGCAVVNQELSVFAAAYGCLFIHSIHGKLVHRTVKGFVMKVFDKVGCFREETSGCVYLHVGRKVCFVFKRIDILI